jgi:serine/threonine protein kinase
VQAADAQIIAGVVLSERLAVTMYGAIHRAQYAGQRNLRGLVVDPKMLAEAPFRAALTSTAAIGKVISLDNSAIVPTVAVESGGPDIVIVTRGVGKYVTVQDLISAARSRKAQGGKLPLPVAATIGKSVVEALAVAHRAGVVHGAVHPRSVLVDDTGDVRVTDFIVGRALTSAVAQGADSSLWRGLAGFLAPELVVGEEPTPTADVFAVGALLFTMLSGEVPPGTLHVTPAVERLVQRALDTDVGRRYRNADDLLENLLEAFEDDRWDTADRGEIIKTAGLGRPDSNVDEATEDLLASLGSGAVQVTPMRPSIDIRASAAAARVSGPNTKNRLDALLADLDDSRELTHVDDDKPFIKDPISELIHMDPRKKEAIVQIKPRVPSLDDPDDETPLPKPARDSQPDVRGSFSRSGSTDEAAAFDAISQLEKPVRRVSSAAEQVSAAAAKLEQAAARAEAVAARAESEAEAESLRKKRSTPLPTPVARPPIIEQPDFDAPPIRLKSRARWIVGVLAIAAIGGAGWFIYTRYKEQEKQTEDSNAERERRKKEAEEATRRAVEAQADRGQIIVSSTPGQAGAWLKLGRAPFDTPFPLTSQQMHEIRVELPGYQSIDTQILASHWTGTGLNRKASLTVTLKPADKVDPKKVDPKKPDPNKLGPTPAKPPDASGFTAGEGPVHVESTPPGAEVWLYIGVTGSVSYPAVAGRAYELRALKDGYLPGYATITPDEWRLKGGDPNLPIDVAKKKTQVEKNIQLTEEQPAGSASKKGK